jgi:signal transduction histidine kinase
VIGAVAEHGGLSFFVQDDSAGFPPEILIHQGRAPGRSATGTGLGLYFAHALAKAHVNKERSGEVRLENRDGAYFSLWLP